jgi:CheY-like chemotaxis protein/anti-sigma regulatory factor (Ser/Thr protein kinase)
VAHDFNNALSLILGYSEILLAEEERLTPAERLHFTRTIITAAKDSARMIERLREFYRPSDEEEVWEHVDLAQLVREAVTLTEPKWRGQAEQRGVAISVQLEVEAVPSIAGNAAELREALTNLIFNAVDAMPDGGKIVLRVRPEETGVLVEVQDSGTGMSEEVRQRCLEPFFTTKGDKGTGLGLAMVYGIAQRHHATLQLESAIGQGTTFRFRFAKEERPPGQGEDVPVYLSHPLNILVVDDQPFICEIMEQYLAQDCHQAEAFTSGEEALARLRQKKFDLVITDLAMPDLTGGQLALAAREIDPQLRIILLTGFGRDERPEEGSEAIDLVLGKPVTLEALRHALAEVFVHSPGSNHAPVPVS